VRRVAFALAGLPVADRVFAKALVGKPTAVISGLTRRDTLIS
jgi:hypothetical protein